MKPYVPVGQCGKRGCCVPENPNPQLFEFELWPYDKPVSVLMGALNEHLEIDEHAMVRGDRSRRHLYIRRRLNEEERLVYEDQALKEKEKRANREREATLKKIRELQEDYDINLPESELEKIDKG